MDICMHSFHKMQYWRNLSYLMASLSSSVLRWVGLISVPMGRRVWSITSDQTAPPSGDHYWKWPPELVPTSTSVYRHTTSDIHLQKSAADDFEFLDSQLLLFAKMCQVHCVCCSVRCSKYTMYYNRGTMRVVLKLWTRMAYVMSPLSKLCGV